MFSLIITIISIALVAALALATLYYGGSSFNKGAASAKATEILNQAQQLKGAMAVYRADHGKWATNLDELVAKGYLKSIPSTVAQAPARGLMASAYAAQTLTWAMPQEGVPTFTLSGVDNLDVCKDVNLKSRGDNGVLVKAYTDLSTQCFGTEGALQVLVTSDPQSVSTVLPQGSLGGTAIPAESDASAWTAQPTAVAAAAEAPSEPASSTPTASAKPFKFTAAQGMNIPYATLSQTSSGYTLLQKDAYKTASAQNNGALGGVVLVTLTNTGEAAAIPSELDQLHVGHGGNFDPSLCTPGATLEKDASCSFYVIGYNASMQSIAPLCSAPVTLFGNQLPSFTLDTCLYDAPFIDVLVNDTDRSHLLRSVNDLESVYLHTDDVMVVSVRSSIANLSDVSLELVSPASLTLTGTNTYDATPYSLHSKASGTLNYFTNNGSSWSSVSISSGSGFTASSNNPKRDGANLFPSDLLSTSCASVAKNKYCHLLHFVDSSNGIGMSPGEVALTYRVKFRVNGGPVQSKLMTKQFRWGVHATAP